MKKFTKADFRNGFYVQLRDGDCYVYINNHLINEKFSINLDGYDDNLFSLGSNRGLDIIKVVRGDNIYSIDNMGLDYNDVVFKRKDEALFYLSNEELHKRLWRDIAEGRIKDKKEWFHIHNEIIEPKNLCFACQEALERFAEDFWTGDGNICGSCPIKKENDEKCCGGLYGKYVDALLLGLEGEKKELAKKIAELEWR